MKDEPISFQVYGFNGRRGVKVKHISIGDHARLNINSDIVLHWVNPLSTIDYQHKVPVMREAFTSHDTIIVYYLITIRHDLCKIYVLVILTWLYPWL